MDRRHRYGVGFSIIAALVLVVGVVSAQDRWVEVAPSAAGTPLSVDLRDEPGGKVIDVELSGFFLADTSAGGRDFSFLKVPGCGGRGLIGQPHLPFQSVAVPVPNGPAANLQVTETTVRDALTGVTVIPQQAPRPDCGSTEPDFVIDDKAYATDAWYPAQAARIAQDVVVRGQRFLIVEVSPLAFNPVRNEVLARQSLTIRIDLRGDIDAAAEARKAERRSLHFPTLVELDGAPLPDSNPTGVEYLIIAHDSLLAAVQPLAEWKQKKGLTVEIVPMSTIGTTSAELKSFLQTRYDSDPDMTYVLFVGDHPMVPSESLSGMVSDLYYSCLDGTDYFPDIVLGRIAVQSEADCINVIDKILTFDRDVVPGAWHGSYLMAALLQTYSCQAERFFFETGTHAMHYIRDLIGMDIYTSATSGNLSCNPYTWREDASWYPHRPPGYANQPVPQADAALITSASISTQDIIDAFNAGVSLVQHRDHGGVTEWSDPPFTNSHVATLANGTMTPVVYSINCLSGTFNSGGDCLAEALMKKYPGGAVGVIAATASSYSGHNDLMAHGSYDCFWDSYDTDDGGNIYPHSFRPAEAYLYGKYYMYHWEGHDSTTQLEFELFHWHGDPEMRAFTAVPVAPSVSLDPTVPVGSSSLAVLVDAEGALVAVTDNGALMGRAVVSGGAAIVDFDPPLADPGTLDVVVSGHNLVPWQGTTDVIVPVGPWMVHSSHLCDDSSGNGDGVVNPGETIVLPITLENVGADSATGISATLATDSGHCTVTDPIADFPDAGVGALVQSLPDHYSVAVSPAAPNGHLARMTLDWGATGGYTGSTIFTVPVCELLSISEVSMAFIGNVSAVVSWTTNVPATSRVTYGTSTPPGLTVESTQATTSHEVEITGLEPCTDYLFEVTSTSPSCYTTTDSNGGTYYGFKTTDSADVAFDSIDTPVSIPDNNPTGASSIITVASPYNVLGVKVLVNITHTYTGDLQLMLISPDSTTVALSTNNGSSGNNYVNTLFDDDAATPISSGSPPFTGSFRPDQPLSTLIGQPAVGEWTFKVVDTAGADTGTIDSWQLQLTVNEPCDTDPIFSDDFEDGTWGAWSAVVP
jgi:subtilisin-like proprotein convertase family protein